MISILKRKMDGGLDGTSDRSGGTAVDDSAEVEIVVKAPADVDVVDLTAVMDADASSSSSSSSSNSSSSSSGTAVHGEVAGQKRRRQLPASITEGEPKIKRERVSAPAVSTAVAIKAENGLGAAATIKLSEAQYRVINAILQRKSVFFTGAAGTGKSYILRVLQDIMAHLGKTSAIAFTAPTGVAACNVRGLTIHSWGGIGLGEDPVEKMLAKAIGNQGARERWLRTEILVIDEISMLSAELFDKLSFIGSRIRNDHRPFGGIQLILCGDFFQLPPVGVGGGKVNFCFEAKFWKELLANRDDGMIVLDKVFRQKDSNFLRILNELRRGVVSRETDAVLQAKVLDSLAAAEARQREAEEDEAFNTARATHLGMKRAAAGESSSDAKARSLLEALLNAGKLPAPTTAMATAFNGSAQSSSAVAVKKEGATAAAAAAAKVKVKEEDGLTSPSGQVWSLADDVMLMGMKTGSAKASAAALHRTEGSIRSRLKHLSDPTHKAYQRYHSRESSTETGTCKTTAPTDDGDGADLSCYEDDVGGDGGCDEVGNEEAKAAAAAARLATFEALVASRPTKLCSTNEDAHRHNELEVRVAAPSLKPRHLVHPLCM